MDAWTEPFGDGDGKNNDNVDEDIEIEKVQSDLDREGYETRYFLTLESYTRLKVQDKIADIMGKLTHTKMTLC